MTGRTPWTMANGTNASVMADRLDDWNDTLSIHLIPVSVILMLYLVLGILGNSVVIYIHIFRLKTNWKERFFIPILAVVDLVTCVVSTSFSFSINMLPVKYSNDSGCKVVYFLNMTCTLMSAFMLVVIAANRYMKICKPFSKQMDMFWKKIAIACVIGAALVMSWPCFFFYGSREVYNDNTQILGYRCTSVRGPWSAVQPLVFKATLVLLMVFVVVLLVVFYILIGRVVFRQMLLNKKKSSHYGPSGDCSQQGKSPNSNSTQSSYTTEVPYINNDSVTDNKSQFDSGIVSPIETNEGPATVDYVCHQKSTTNEPKQDQSLTYSNVMKMSRTKTGNKSPGAPGTRLALIFMLITIVFIVCYVPKVGMMIYESQNEKFWIELSASELSGFRFIYTAFIINNIVNPIIYGFLDRRFRGEVYRVFRCGKK
ncbi:cholecystokinin receptor type A-like [Argopecten irradians]|uniref:cholecystokinin receptor type A-like n=1 Tax=Argopecten irradians TaxID=31199 RepID=UPI003710B76C